MMKKTLIAAAALMAGVAAQAQVNVYGNMDLSFGSFELPGDDSSVTAVESGVHTGSFLGFKGSEDLGGGLKAFFVLESDIGADEGTNNMWARTSELGLAGDFGTVKLGNSRSLRFLANAAYNPFPVTGMMNTSQFIDTYTQLAMFGVTLGNNKANSITYTSPNLSGFTIAAQYGASEADGVDGDFGLALNYAAGPLAVGFNYADEVDSLVTRWQLGGSYDFGAAKLFGQYGQNKIDGVDNKQKVFQIGVAAPLTAQGTLIASYAHSKVSGLDWKVTDLSVVYDHALSKRTSAYAGIKNVRDNAEDPKNGTSFAVGVKHSF